MWEIAQEERAAGMRTRRSLSAGICLALCATIPAWSQTRPNGFYLTSPLSIGSGYDQNFMVASNPSGTLDDSITLLTLPTLDWTLSTHQTTFSVDYRPEFELFADHSELNAWNHSSTMRYSRTINSRTTIDAGNSFLSTSDSSAELQNSLVLLPYGRFTQNTFYADVRYRIDTVTKLTFRFDNAITTMDLPGALQGRLNEVGSAGTVTLDRALTSRQSLSGSYSYLYVDPLNRQTGGSPTGVDLLMLSYSYQIDPTLLVRCSAGGITGSESAFNGSAAIEKQLGGVWLAAGYQRYLGFFNSVDALGQPSVNVIPFANGVTPDSVYQVVSLRASGQLTKRVGLELVAQKAFTQVDSAGLSIRSLIGQLKVSYKLNRRFALFVRAEHYGQNINEFSNLPLSRNRFLAGVEVVLSKPPEPAGQHDRRAIPAQDSGETKQGDGQSPGGE
jgi:hypothetical protein